MPTGVIRVANAAGAWPAVAQTFRKAPPRHHAVRTASTPGNPACMFDLAAVGPRGALRGINSRGRGFLGSAWQLSFDGSTCKRGIYVLTTVRRSVGSSCEGTIEEVMPDTAFTSMRAGHISPRTLVRLHTVVVYPRRCRAYTRRGGTFPARRRLSAPCAVERRGRRR